MHARGPFCRTGHQAPLGVTMDEIAEDKSGNIFPGATVGCHIAHFHSDWVLGVDTFNTVEQLKRDLGLRRRDTVPDFSIDPGV